MGELLKLLRNLDPGMISKLVTLIGKLQGPDAETKIRVSNGHDGCEYLCISSQVDGQQVKLTLQYPPKVRENLGLGLPV